MICPALMPDKGEAPKILRLSDFLLPLLGYRLLGYRFVRATAGRGVFKVYDHGSLGSNIIMIRRQASHNLSDQT